MTVDDLIAVFEKARAEAAPFPQHHEDGLYAGIAAVVRALRDELSMSKDINSCSACDANYDLFHEILGDAGEKVAGGSTREDGLGGVEQAVPALTPATDAAPAVCAWTLREAGRERSEWQGCEKVWRTYTQGLEPTTCPSCGKLIAFTEAK